MVAQCFRKRLLVLDDEQDVAATICNMVPTGAFDTDHTDSTDVFLAMVASWLPTHIAIDLQLADRDGIEVIHQLADMDCQAELIIISGLGSRIINAAARAAEEQGLRLIGALAKPFSRAEFLALLNSDEAKPQSSKTALTPASNPKATRLALAKAIEDNSLLTYFQPKIHCRTGDLVGFECLARWPTAAGSDTSTEQFIGMAEETGLIHELTRQLFGYALVHLPQKNHNPPLKYALNLSPINLRDETFPLWLLEKCYEYGVPPAQIILELTETASMDKPLLLLERLTQFRIRGFQLSIDDFGVGYSSLVQLARLPFSELKIDQMFVKTLSSSEESRKIVTAVIGLGKSLNLHIVAEGVEDAWALNFLRQAGCDEAQGYFIAYPLDYRSAASWQNVTQAHTQ